MTRNRWLVVCVVLPAMALIAQAQDRDVIDFRAWLARQPPQEQPAAPDELAARDAVRAQIKAFNEDRVASVGFDRGGQWLSNQRDDVQPWSIQTRLNRNDGTLGGRISLGGSGLLSAGNISGRVSGATVSGVVTNDDGAQLATFTGKVDGTSMSGTYQAADGDTGTWAYQEPRPGALGAADVSE